jgi:hypothetical protein
LLLSGTEFSSDTLLGFPSGIPVANRCFLAWLSPVFGETNVSFAVTNDIKREGARLKVETADSGIEIPDLSGMPNE